MSESEPRRLLIWGGVFGVLAAVLLWSRLAGLHLSFWHDEVVTVLRYASQGPNAIFFSEYSPNNHVLFELIAWVTTRLFGETEVVYRLWAVIPALAATAWLTWWMCRRFGHLASATLLLLIALSPLLLDVSRQARGYGLAMLAMTGLITQGDAALTDPESRAIWGFALFGGIGVLTLPVFVLPYTLAALGLLFEPRLRARLLIGLVASGVVALAWFFPMLGGIVERSSQQYGVKVPWHGFVTLSLSHLLFPIFGLLWPGVSDIARGTRTIVTLIWHGVSWALFVMGALWLWRNGRGRLLGMLAVMTMGTYLVLAALGLWAVNRFLSYLSLPLFVSFALGIENSVQILPKKGRRVALASLAGIAAWSLVNLYPVAVEMINVPIEATKDASELANASGADLVVTNSTRPDGFRYYLEISPTIMTASKLESLFCADNGSSYVFIDHPFRAEKVDTSCLEEDDVFRVRLEQRGRGQLIDVWFVGLPEPSLAGGDRRLAESRSRTGPMT